MIKNVDYASLSLYRKQLNLNPQTFEKDLEAKYVDFMATNEENVFNETLYFPDLENTCVGCWSDERVLSPNRQSHPVCLTYRLNRAS